MNEIAFTLFGLQVRWYAIILVTGMVAALFLLIYLLKKVGQPTELGMELFLWVIPLAVLFARLFYSVPRPEFYPIKSFGDFIRLFAIWEGGATIIGGIFGGILGVILCSLTRKKSIARIADIMICPLLLGQVIGRWGNYVNQEVFGIPITNPAFMKFPFGVFIDHTGEWHYASFFYESLLNFLALVVFFIIIIKFHKKIKAGVIAIAYLAWYNIVRALLETIKLDPLTSASGVKITQTICAVLGAAAIVVLVLVQLGVVKLETQKMRLRHFSTSSEGGNSAKPNKKGFKTVLITDEKNDTCDIKETEDNGIDKNSSDNNKPKNGKQVKKNKDKIEDNG